MPSSPAFSISARARSPSFRSCPRAPPRSSRRIWTSCRRPRSRWSDSRRGKQLKERAKLRPGQKVFIPAGSGGIGTFAIQLAKHLGAKVGTTTSTGNMELVKSLGADEVIDYKKREFEEVLRDYDAVLGTVRGDAIEKSLQILKPKSNIVSLIGPPDAAFARSRGMNCFFTFVFGLLSRKIIRRARKRGIEYSFLFAHPDGQQLTEIGELLKAGRIRPLIDKVFPFDQAKDALAYLEKGRAKGKVVVQIR